MSGYVMNYETMRPERYIPDKSIPTPKISDEIDVLNAAKKALATLVLCITNPLLSLTVYATRLTGFTIITGMVIGHLTKPLHAANAKLAKYTCSPLRNWAEALKDENTRIVKAERVFKVSQGRLKFLPDNYRDQLKGSLKAIIAPVSLAFNALSAAVWVVAKPLWLAFFAGMVVDILVTGPLWANKEISQLTYEPLKDLSDKFYQAHLKYLDSALPKNGF